MPEEPGPSRADFPPIEAPDKPLAAALRFVLEVVAWIAIQRIWGWGAVVVAILLLSLFNARGDKRVQGILIPGPLRVVLEVGVMLVGAWALALWLGPLAGVAFLVALQGLFFVGRARYAWLLRR